MSSSSIASDSDDSRRHSRNRPPPPPPPFPGSKRKSKKKKKPLPPQETINKIWSRFSAKKFSKATTILPFARSATAANFKSSVPAKLPPDNLLVSEDYERAVHECRNKVRKLIKECLRVNMRYRDAEFDIDWDLKCEKGHCLNGLAENRFEVNGRAFANPTSNVPKAVKRVHEIFEKPSFLKDKISPADVKQGTLGDCWLMASLTALGNMEVGISRICVEYNTKIGIYGFVFHRDGEWIHSIIDDKLYLKSPDWDSPSVQRHLLEQTDREDVEKEYRKTYQTGSQSLYFAHCRDQNETWLPLLEKAYAKAHGDYAALGGGWIGEGVEDLTGGVTTELLTSDILDIDEFWTNEIMKVNKEFLFGCSTGLLDGGYGSRDGISEGHAYVIMEARELSTGERLLKLRNPWGKGKKGNWEGAWSDGSKEFTPEAQRELNHKFGNDSVFWISYPDLLRKYQHFDRTRLFMDSLDWRITQKWISVEVPWKAEFEQRFRLVLKKESPVVLVLSQLDDRYFDGLQGQYSFRLQFRLHNVDSPGEEDYIVRSHGNYLMERSVVTELKSLEVGTYSVFVMVVAERDSLAPSVEEVIKAQCRLKTDNEKLAQVGMAYDHAHSKAAVYMESKTDARKATDKAKARESRIGIRRKNWEKRHLQREIMRKQEKKNREKRDRKDKQTEAEEMGEEEKEPKDMAVQTGEVVIVTDVVIVDDKAVQTEDPSVMIEEPAVVLEEESQPINERDKGVQVDLMAASFSASQSTPETPKSSPLSNSPPLRAQRSPPGVIRIPGRASVLPPLAPPPPSSGQWGRKQSPSNRHSSRSAPPPPPRYITSDGESSASPISDYDDMYSDDDPTLKPRPINQTGGSPKPKDKDSDDEDEPEPWNAVCIVGLRVYSKDEELEVRIFEESVDDGDVKRSAIAKEDDGTDADVEDDANEPKKSESIDALVEEKIRDVENETKVTDATDPGVPIRSKEPDVVIINEEKKAFGLATEDSALSEAKSDGGVEIAAMEEGESVEKVEPPHST